MSASQPSQGLTDSERYLFSLGRKAFLSLWSYPNVFRDQGKVGSGDGKEVADLLVVFGNDILVFSDKHIELRTTAPPAVAWARWTRAAVVEGAKQLFGAERWIRQYPTRLFIDKACSAPLPISLPSMEQVRFHRIVVVRGAADLCQKILGGSGSLIITNEEFASGLFTIGQPFPNKGFVHVMDEAALDMVLGHLDTVADFVSYLVKKERLFTSGMKVLAAGEEELLGAYLYTLDSSKRHDFIFEPNIDYVAFDEGIWSEFQQSEQRRRQIEADAVSYAWDELTEKFIYHIRVGDQHFASPGGIEVHEQIVRWFAREPRIRRRILARKLASMIDEAKPGTKRATVIPPVEEGDPYWVLLVLPHPSYAGDEEYREVRRGLLGKYCLVVKHLNPTAKDVIGLAVNCATDREMTEDAIYLDARIWDAEIAADARQWYEEFGLLQTAIRSEEKEYEFPT